MYFPPFQFKQFAVEQETVAHPVGTDGVLLGAWADVSGARRVLDVGTGSGVIALMAAQRTDANVEIDALDIHADSCAQAARNFAASPWAGRLRVWHGALQDCAPEGGAPLYDLMLSNPPFFSEAILSPDIARRHARSVESLPFEAMVAAMERLLRPEGRCCLILPAKESGRLRETAAIRGWYATRETLVYARAGARPERSLLQLERNPLRFKRDELYIHEKGAYAAGYRALCAPFYLNM